MSMDVFKLREELVGEYGRYAESFLRIKDERVHEHLQAELSSGLLWPDPRAQLNPAFESGGTIDDLVAAGTLHEECSRIFRVGKDPETNPEGIQLRLHRHQTEAIEKAREGKDFVLTTGTGSGKSLAYIVPAVDHALRAGARNGKIKALVVYPMNALANSQMGELEKFLCYGYEPGAEPVTFARYTGQEDDEQRQAIQLNPPDVLLTNYVMLEYLLTRPEDRKKLIAKTDELRFLVLDELHTYRGRQGADVGLLVRRVRNASGSKQLRIVGTSATLAGTGSHVEQTAEVAEVASRIFGAKVEPDSVIGETLRTETEEADLADEGFVAGLRDRLKSGDPTPGDYEGFVADPLARWVERTLGVRWNAADERIERCEPFPISGPDGAAAQLSQQTGVSKGECEAKLRETLLAGSTVLRQDLPFPVFAFRLHQFLSGGATIWASLDQEQERQISTTGQQFVPGDRDRSLLPLAFCRECGQDYYAVRKTAADGGTFVPREISDHSAEENEQDGFLYLSSDEPWPADPQELLGRVPADWLTSDGDDIKKSQKRHLPVAVSVATDGRLDPAGRDGVFVAAPFRFCLSCGVTYGARLRSDFTKLATLGAGGRSTSTTILGLSTLEYLREKTDLERSRRKILSFTDNRQDASLQAGHFNDFVEVSLLRSGLYKAAAAAGDAGLGYTDVAPAALATSGLKPTDYASNPDLKGNAKTQRDAAMEQVVAYRIYADQTRWRLTSPNLEQTGLIRIEYSGLDDWADDDESFARQLPAWLEAGISRDPHPALTEATPETRSHVARVLLDFMRRELAISCDQLNRNQQESIAANSRQYLVDPWVIDDFNELNYASAVFPRPRGNDRDDRTGVYLSPRGSFGGFLRRHSTFPHLDHPLDLEETTQIIAGLINALQLHGLVDIAVEAPDGDVPGFQIQAPVLRWIAQDGTVAFRDELRTPQESKSGAQTNKFFVDLYKDLAGEGRGEIVAREHTAQVPAEERQIREDEFRTGELPLLFCSPTMELGVDIADLNVVNLRNVPPTPANYAQRSGRAGRSGDAALVYTFCSSWNSHDQYFFRRTDRMVSGKVSPPALDLANEDLVRAHINAIWLAETGAKLGSSMTDVLDTDGSAPTLAIRAQLSVQLEDGKAKDRAKQRAASVMEALGADLDGADWFDETWIENTINGAIQSFDRACDRWRGLFTAAQTALDSQNSILKDASTTPYKRSEAQRLHREASSQLSLLRGAESSAFQSDFYTYRYFASEGFLPGYNFPRLPLSAFIPARRSRKGHDDFLSRPRFLAISEFGPGSIIYHEGSRFQVTRAILPAAEGDDLALASAKRCAECGYLHPIDEGDGPDLCEYCHEELGLPTRSMLRLQNVITRRRERISSDEEERQRTGYELRTAVRFDQASKRTANAIGASGNDLATLEYAGSALIWRINNGWSRRAEPDVLGFAIDTKTGRWEANKQVPVPDPEDPGPQAHVKRVIPFVEDRRNSLLISPATGIVGNDAMASLQAALKRGIQAVFQLEENELAVEPLPDEKDRRQLLLYESAEGGAGVLRRLLEPGRLAEVATEALRICHFDPATGEDLGPEQPREPCDMACYDCLLSYSNQRDHRAIDRKLISKFLLEVAAGNVEKQQGQANESEHLKNLKALCDSQLERDFLDLLVKRGLKLPTYAQKLVPAHRARPDFTYNGEHMPVAIFIDGPHHDDAHVAGKDAATRASLEDGGFQVIAFKYDSDWNKILDNHKAVFGSDSGG